MYKYIPTDMPKAAPFVKSHILDDRFRAEENFLQFCFIPSRAGFINDMVTFKYTNTN